MSDCNWRNSCTSSRTVSVSSSSDGIHHRRGRYRRTVSNPGYNEDFLFTLYQHKVEINPPMDSVASKYKVLTQMADFSPCIFNGDTLYLTYPAPYVHGKVIDPDTLKEIFWEFTFIGKVKHRIMYYMFRENIFKPGKDMGYFDIDVKYKNPKNCLVGYDKRFKGMWLRPFHKYYKTSLRFSKIQGEILYFSEFATKEEVSNALMYSFFPKEGFCKNVNEYLEKVYGDEKDEKKVVQIAKNYLLNKTIITPYNGKIYKIGQVDFKSTPINGFQDRETKEHVTLVDHYKKKYNIDILPDETPLLVAFPTKTEDFHEGKMENIYLIPRLCFILYFKKDAPNAPEE